MKLYSQHYTRRQIEAHTGRLEQIGGLRRFVLAEGPEAGVQQIEVRTGAGLRYVVSPSRGLDISLATFGDVPLSWQSANGEVHPAFFEAEGIGWLRTAVGGLLMTCGLTYVGAPGEGEGIHGRIHHLPARHTAAEGYWLGDEYEVRVAGTMEETRIFGEHLRLGREIRSRLGENRIYLKDVVENVGFAPCPHMILYHFNFGFPLLQPETTITFPSTQVIPREPETALEGYNTWQPPQSGYQERVYYHLGMPMGRVSAVLHTPNFPTVSGKRPISLTLSWSTEQLPRLVQWKMPGAGEHVLGIEPANCHVEGRAAERERGTLVILQPGESRTYELEVEIG